MEAIKLQNSLNTVYTQYFYFLEAIMWRTESYFMQIFLLLQSLNLIYVMLFSNNRFDGNDAQSFAIICDLFELKMFILCKGED